MEGVRHLAGWVRSKGTLQKVWAQQSAPMWKLARFAQAIVVPQASDIAKTLIPPVEAPRAPCLGQVRAVAVRWVRS